MYYISRNILKLFLKIFFKLKVIDPENLPDKGPYIAASNHVSYLDPSILAAGIPVSARFLARENLFRKGLFGWWIRSVGCIPVKRSKRDIKAMKEALKFLKKGGVLAVFPEGTRSIDGSLKQAHVGMGFLAFKADAPIVPAYIKGSKEALRKHSKHLRLRPVSIYFGKRIEPAAVKKVGDPKTLYKRISQEVMARISELKERHGD